MNIKFIKVVTLIVISSTVFGQDSLNMTRHGYLGGMLGGEYSDIWGYTDSLGKEYAIIGSRRAINVVDVSNCAQPVIDTSYIDGSNVTWRDFKRYGHYIYAVCDGSDCTEGLQIINMNTGQLTQNTSHFIKAHNIYLEETTGRLYVVGSNTKHLIIYDVAANPANPVLLKEHNFPSSQPGYIHDIYVRGYKGYASHGFSGFVIYDFTDVNNIISYNTGNNLDPNEYNHSSWLDDSGLYSYVAFEAYGLYPLSIYKINPSDYSYQKIKEFNHPQLPNINTSNRPHNPFVKGDSLYISYYHDGVQVWNIEDRENPILVGYYDTYPSNTNYSGYFGCWGVYPYFDSGCIVASDLNSGLHTLQMLPPEVEAAAPIVFDAFDKGLVFKNENGAMRKITVNNQGDFLVTPYLVTSDITRVINSEIHFLPSQTFIFQAPNGNYYEMVVSAGNAVSTNLLASLPSVKVSSSQDIIIDSTDKNSAYLYNAAAQKVKLKINSANKVQVIPHPWVD